MRCEEPRGGGHASLSVDLGFLTRSCGGRPEVLNLALTVQVEQGFWGWRFSGIERSFVLLPRTSKLMRPPGPGFEAGNVGELVTHNSGIARRGRRRDGNLKSAVLHQQWRTSTIAV